MRQFGDPVPMSSDASIKRDVKPSVNDLAVDRFLAALAPGSWGDSALHNPPAGFACTTLVEQGLVQLSSSHAEPDLVDTLLDGLCGRSEERNLPMDPLV